MERERTKDSYAVAPYFGAKLAAELPLSALFPLIFGTLVYPATGLHPRLSRPALSIYNLQDTENEYCCCVSCRGLLSRQALFISVSLRT